MVFLRELDLNPSTSLVLAECEQEGLITSNQKADISSKAKLWNADAVFELVKLMKRSGNEGYKQFREILKKRSVESLADKNLFTKLVRKENDVGHLREAASKAVSKGSLLCTLEVLITSKYFVLFLVCLLTSELKDFVRTF